MGYNSVANIADYLHSFSRYGLPSRDITWNCAKIWPYSSSRSSKV